METLLLVLAQSGGSLLWPFLIIVALAIIIWLLSWLLFPDPVPKPTHRTLQGLTGLDDAMAAKLQRFGVYSDKDLIRLSPRGQQELESQLGLHSGEYARWREEIMLRWRESYLPPQLRGIENIYPDPELGGLYSKQPERCDALEQIPGIDKLTANRMNAAGIYTFEQLRLLTPEQRANVKNRFSLTGFQFDSIPLQSSMDRRDVSSATSAIASKAKAGTPDRSTQAGTGVTSQTDVTSQTGTGVTSPTAPGATGTSSPAVSAVASFASSSAGIPKSKIDPELGRVYSAPPPHRDDLTKLPGIDHATAEKLNEAGVYTTDQLLSLSPNQQAVFKRRFNLPSIDFGSWKRLLGAAGGTVSGIASEATKQSGGDHAATQHANQSLASSLQSSSGTTPSSSYAQTATSGTPVVGAKTTSSQQQPQQVPGSQSGNSDIGYVYVTAPRDPDDLTTLDGITSDVAKRMNAAGIYKLHQLKTMSEAQREAFSKQFGLPRSLFASWTSAISRSATNVPESSIPGSSVSGSSGSAGVDASGAGAGMGGRASTAQSAPYKGSSHTSSSDSSKKPVGFATGVSTPSGSTVSTDSTTSTPASGATASSASAAGSATTGAPTDALTKSSPYGLVYATRPGQADDLTKLQGIDTATATKLNAAGIYTYEQLRGLDSQQFSRLSTDFGLESVDFADWRRCIHAWSRGIATTAEVARTYRTGWLHGVRLPEVVKGVFDGKQLVAYPEQVVFRGSNAEKWGQAVSHAGDGVERSLAADEVRSDINYVRIRRVDTRESVVTPITKGQLFSPGPPEGNGWNGLCESFFGGRHLGIFASDIPNEMETRFGLGGWGFGHRFDHNDQQEWGWAGRVIEPTTFEISVGHIGSPSGTVVFRANDPTIWNQRVREGNDRFAIPVDAVTHPVNYLRMLRVDSGEAIVIRVDRGSLLRRGDNPRLGWNGLCDEFSGGHHLGIYHREAPQSVEICFGEGGWGFGHPFGDNDRQAFGWGGHAIGGPTIFEISLLEHLPDYLRHELLE